MHGRLRKPLRFIFYFLVCALFALFIFWVRGLLWPAEYQELRTNLFWVFMAAVGVAVTIIYTQEMRKDDANNDDDP